jgi:hypothetical protein
LCRTDRKVSPQKHADHERTCHINQSMFLEWRWGFPHELGQRQEAGKDHHGSYNTETYGNKSIERMLLVWKFPLFHFIAVLLDRTPYLCG